MENSAKFGLKNIRRIPVSGAFHTPLMEPAIKHFKAMLYNTIIEKPRITVYANCNAEYYREPETIRKSLVKHLVQPVKWEQIIHKMYERPAGSTFPRTFDVGSIQKRVQWVYRNSVHFRRLRNSAFKNKEVCDYEKLTIFCCCSCLLSVEKREKSVCLFLCVVLVKTVPTVEIYRPPAARRKRNEPVVSESTTNQPVADSCASTK